MKNERKHYSMRPLPEGMAADLKTAAAKAGYNLHYFRRLCHKGRINCTPRGHSFFFTTEQLASILDIAKVPPGVEDIFEGLV